MFAGEKLGKVSQDTQIIEFSQEEQPLVSLYSRSVQPELSIDLLTSTNSKPASVELQKKKAIATYTKVETALCAQDFCGIALLIQISKILSNFSKV
ncbi:unnamed protein product [Cylicocyclus nassatus]|uniref:Uncharacterized protein n=1 Tax=Cylicocyclus nassatus TaxID=53992 RepID=A0AA36GIL4_CYLNA|nr:unnamed protein product [Cylicocyclus nassatus]